MPRTQPRPARDTNKEIGTNGIVYIHPNGKRVFVSAQMISFRTLSIDREIHRLLLKKLEVSEDVEDMAAAGGEVNA